MKTATNTSPPNSSSLKVRNLIGRLAACAVLLTAVSASASTFTWSGAAGNSLFTSTNNWSPVTAARPSAPQSDTLVFDGTVSGDLMITNGPGNGVSADTSPGFSINVLAGQTSPLTFVQSNTFAGRIRLNITNMLTVASGAGPVTFGQDGSASDFILAMGNAGATPFIHTITNNSTVNTVTFKRNISLVQGGGNLHIFSFFGPGNFQFDSKLKAALNTGGSSVGMTVNGPGTVTLVGNSPITTPAGLAGIVTVNGGTLVFGGVNALESGPTLILNGGSLDSSVANLVLSPGLNAQTWGGDFTFIGTQDLNLGAGVVTMAANRNVTVNAGTLTVDGTVSGAGRLAKSGAGTLYLSSTMSYTGGTIISNGVLRLNMFPSGTSVAESLSVFGGTLDVNGNSFLVSALNGTSGAIDTISVGTPTLTVGDFDANGSFSGAIQNTAGSMALIKTGVGSLTLGGASTYSGGTTVSGGTLLVTNTTGSGTGSGAVTNSSGATFGGSGTVSGTVNWQSGSLAAFIQGSPLTVSSSVTLNNNPVTINVPGAAPLGSGTYTLMTYNNSGSSGSFSVGSPTFTGAGVAAGSSVSVATGSGLVQLVVLPPPGPSATWTNNGNGNWSVPANWMPNQVSQVASSVATLGLGSAFTTVTLDIPVTNGFISFNNTNSFAIANAGNTLTLDNTNGGAAIIVVNGSSNSIAAPVSLGDTVGVSTFPGASLAISGNISGTSTSRTLVVDSGSGTLVLSGNNTYGPSAGSVGTTIKGSGTSTLQLDNNNALGAGDVSVSRNATIRAGAALNVTNNFIVTNSVTATFDNNGNSVTLSGVISGNGGIAKNGAGTLTLNNANTYTNDTSINVGTIKLGNASGISGGISSGNVNMSTNTVLDLNGFSPVLGGLSASAAASGATVDSTSAGSMTLTLGENGAFTAFYGNIKNSSGSIILAKDGAGNQTLAGTNTYSGGTTINAGLLRVGNGNTNAAAGLGTGSITNNGTLEFNVFGTITFTNALYGSGALNLANTNLVFNLYGNNNTNFTGNINVNLGLLSITNASALGTGVKTVTAIGGANSLFTQIRLKGSSGYNINLDTNITFTLSQAIGVLISEAGSNTINGSITMPNGGGNPYIVVSNGSFLTLAGPVTTVAGNNPRTLTLGGAGNGLLSGTVFDIVSDATLPQGSFQKNDAGTWTITSTNRDSGSATVVGGTLKLLGQWAGGPVVVSTNATLKGTGLASNLTVSAGGIFVPGDYGSVGSFTVSNIMTLSGTMYVSLNKSLGQPNSLVNVLSYNNTNVVANTGSSLVVSNLGPALVAGDKFYLFNQAVTNGDLVTLTVPTLSGGRAFTNMLAVDGSIEVVQAVNPNSGPIQFSRSGNALTLGWPTNLGWTLQVQTNTLSVGLRTNWFDVPASTTVTQSVITINPANPTVFYRLRL